MLARLALGVGGLLAVLLTPAFALSYFISYGVPDELPPAWLSQAQGPLTDAGLLVAGSTSLYDRYGLLYLAASALALAGLVGLLRPQCSEFAPRVRRAWAVLVTGLVLVEVGILGDYGAPSDIVGGVGFVLTGLGFLIAAAGCGMLGWALRRDHAARVLRSWGVGALGVGSVIGGLVLVGHIPSGPGLGFAFSAIVLGLSGSRRITPET